MPSERRWSAFAVKVALLLGQEMATRMTSVIGWVVISSMRKLSASLMRLPAPVAAVSNEVAAVALVISALALGAQSSAPG